MNLHRKHGEGYRGRSNFTVDVIDDVICVIDLGTDMSVTNDAEDVVHYCVTRFGDKPIVYRDTDGNWDRLAHTFGCFDGFVHLGAKSRPEAIAKVKK